MTTFNYSLEMMKVLESHNLLQELSPEAEEWAKNCLSDERVRIQEAVIALTAKQQALRTQLNAITQELDSITTNLQILTS